MAGAVEAIERLQASGRFEVYVLTAPSTRNPLSYTEKRLWIEKHFGYAFNHRLIICGNKGLLRGDLLIDDHVEGRGQEHFQGRVIHFGSPAFPTWAEVLEALWEGEVA